MGKPEKNWIYESFYKIYKGLTKEKVYVMFNKFPPNWWKNEFLPYLAKSDMEDELGAHFVVMTGVNKLMKENPEGLTKPLNANSNSGRTWEK